jgi:hypothetical protein
MLLKPNLAISLENGELTKLARKLIPIAAEEINKKIMVPTRTCTENSLCCMAYVLEAINTNDTIWRASWSR